MVAAAWYRGPVAGRRPGTGGARATARGARPTVGPSTAHHEPGSRCDADLGRRQGLERVERPDLDVGAGRVQLVELLERAGAREVHHERAGAQAGGERGGGVGDGGVGRGDDHEVGVAAGVGDLATAGAPSRSAAAPGRRRVGRRGRRPRPRVQPRAAERERRRSSRRGRDPRGRAPVAIDSARAPLRSLPLRSGPGAGAGLLGRRQSLDRSGAPMRASAGIRARPAPGRGRRGARARTPARSSGGAGTTRSGSSTCSSPTSSTSTSSVRGPQRSARTRSAVGLERAARARAASRGASVGVDRDDRVQVVGLGRTTDGRGLVHRRHRDDVDAVGCGEPVDRLLQVREPVAEVRADPEIGAARRATSRHRSMRTATWSTIARTGGCSLRTVTADPGDALVDAAHLGDAGGEPLEQLVPLGRDDPAHRLGDRRVVDGVVERVALARREQVDGRARRRPRTAAGRVCSSGSTPCTPSSRSPVMTIVPMSAPRLASRHRR